jgi:carbamoyl-phosphate synthase large subunit
LVGHRDELELLTSAKFILPSPEFFDLGSDKLETARFLERNGFSFPHTCIADDKNTVSAMVNEYGFPLFAKPRKGQGSRGLFTCNSYDDITYIQSLDVEYVIQEFIGDVDNEYTIGVVATEESEVLGSIILRRWLQEGQTHACEVVKDEKITTYTEDIARALRPRGYINIQLRLRDGMPTAFEINPRVSSSTGFRGLANFNEPELILRKYLLSETPARPVPSLIAMVRTINETIVTPDNWAKARS